MLLLRYPFLILLAILCILQLNAQVPYPNSAFADVNGVRLHYRHWKVHPGDALGSIIMIHGFGGSTFSWQIVADSLNMLGYEVVAVDMPPFGYSDKSHRLNRSVTAQADHLQELIRQEFPGRKWYMAGHSMGGAIVQAYALCYPDDLHSVTFVAPALFSQIRITENPARLLLRLSPMHFILGELAEEWFIRERRIENLLKSAYGMEPTAQQVQAYLEPLAYPGTARAILSSATYNQELYELDASDLEVPAIAIWGDADSWVPHTSRKRALKKMPGVDLVLMENVGHNPMETHPKDFINIWLAFLNICQEL